MIIMMQEWSQEQQTSSSSPGTPSLLQRRKQMKQGLQNIGAKFQGEQLAQRRDQVRQGLKNVGSKFQQFNLGKLIDQMEQDQGLADQLETLNERMKEEVERREIRREAEAACLQTIQDHLKEFLPQQPNATYEDWIEDLHPENTYEGKLLADMGKEVDLRFYVEESDHRRIWNEHVSDPVRQVVARTRMWSDNNQQPIDLLSGTSDAAVESTNQDSLSSEQNVVDLLAGPTNVTPQIDLLPTTKSDGQEVDLIQF